MGFLDFLWDTEERAKESAAVPDEKTNEIEEAVLEAATSIERIDEKKAMGIPSIGSAVNLLAGTIAMLPVKLYKVNADENKVEEVKGDPRIKLINDDVSPYMNGYQLKYNIVKDYIIHGKAYIYIKKAGIMPERLTYIDPLKVQVEVNQDILNPVYQMSVDNKKLTVDNFVIVSRNSKDGISGQGILELNQPSLQVSYYTTKNELTNSVNGGMYRGFLESENKLSEDALKSLRKMWLKMTRSSSGQVAVLNKGLKFKEGNMTASEQQMNENKKSNATELSSLINVPQEMFSGAYDAKKETRLNKYTIGPITTAITAGLDKALLLEVEKDTHFFGFDMEELNKADILQRYSAYKIGLNEGFLTGDEVRFKENQNPLGLNQIRLGLGTVLYDTETGEYFVPNTGQVKGGEQTNESGDQS